MNLSEYVLMNFRKSCAESSVKFSGSVMQKLKNSVRMCCTQSDLPHKGAMDNVRNRKTYERFTLQQPEQSHAQKDCSSEESDMALMM